ncbi:hypothetical protein D3C80_1733420 [compost metagenome]
MAKFQQQVSHANKSATPSYTDNMFHKDCALPGHQFHEGHGEARGFRKTFSEMVERKLKDCEFSD